MISSIGTSLINVIFSLATTFIKIILSPIDLLIARFLPSVNDMITYISNFLDYVFTYIGWVIDAFGIPQVALTFIIALFVLRYAIYFSVYLFKIIFGWVRK